MAKCELRDFIEDLVINLTYKAFVAFGKKVISVYFILKENNV